MARELDSTIISTVPVPIDHMPNIVACDAMFNDFVDRILGSEIIMFSLFGFSRV